MRKSEGKMVNKEGSRVEGQRKRKSEKGKIKRHIFSFLILPFSFLLAACILSFGPCGQVETAFAGALNISRNADSVWVSVSAKNPTWRAMWKSYKGYTIWSILQPYNSSTELLGTNPDNGGYGTAEYITVAGTPYCNSRRDHAPSITVVESTDVRFMIYVIADLMDTVNNRDRGDVQDTISIYYDRIVYNRSVVLDSASYANTYRAEVCGFVQAKFADWCRHVDDDEKCLEEIGHQGCNDYQSGCSTIDSLNARIYKYATFNDTVFTEYLYFTNLGQNYEVEHDASDRRGKGWNRSGSTPAGTYHHIFQLRIATDDTLGNSVQDKLCDLLNPASIACTYGDTQTYRWSNARGCYNFQDAFDTDSVQFTFTRVSWVDTVFRPIVQIHHWNTSAPDSIEVGGSKKVLNADYYADTTMISGDTMLVLHYLTDITQNTEFLIPMRGAGAPVEGRAEPVARDDDDLKGIIKGGITR
jgi:hypothetical protein